MFDNQFEYIRLDAKTQQAMPMTVDIFEALTKLFCQILEYGRTKANLQGKPAMTMRNKKKNGSCIQLINTLFR